jgi:hypothetical protein
VHDSLGGSDCRESDQEESQSLIKRKSKIRRKKVPQDKPECPYGSRCYRKNPSHIAEFSHPGIFSCHLYIHVCICGHLLSFNR